MNHVQVFHLGTDCTLAISCVLSFTVGESLFTAEALKVASQAVISSHPIVGSRVANCSRGTHLQPAAIHQWDGKTLQLPEGGCLAQWCDHVAWSEACRGVDSQEALARFVVSPPVPSKNMAADSHSRVGLVLLVHHIATDARGLVQLLRELLLAASSNSAKQVGLQQLHHDPPATAAAADAAHPLEDWMPRFTSALKSQPVAAAPTQLTPPSFPKLLPPCLPASQLSQTAEAANAAEAASGSTDSLSPPPVCPVAASCLGTPPPWSRAVAEACQAGAQVPTPLTAPWGVDVGVSSDSLPVGFHQPLKPAQTQFTSRLRLGREHSEAVLGAAKAAGVGVWAWLQAASLLVEASMAASVSQAGSPVVWPVRARTFVDARGLVDPPLSPTFVGPITGVASLETMTLTPSSSVLDVAAELQHGLAHTVESLDVLRTVQTLLFGGSASLSVNNYGALTQLHLPDRCGVVVSDVWVVRQERTAPAAHEQFNIVAFSLHGQLHLSVSFMPAVWHERCVGTFLHCVAELAVAAAIGVPLLKHNGSA